MGVTIRKSNERGFFDHGWLKTYHTFSFASYYDPRFMGYGNLRVLNEDRVAPSQGFGMHSHRDMEIISYVVEGELGHKDSLGTGSTIHAGELQLMHAGTGITHGEFNPSSTDTVYFLQIWIVPDKTGYEPGYQQTKPSLKKNSWNLVASKNGQDKSLTIHQDVQVFLLDLENGATLTRKVAHPAWLQVISGEYLFNDLLLNRGDGVAIEAKTEFRLVCQQPGQIIFFD